MLELYKAARPFCIRVWRVGVLTDEGVRSYNSFADGEVHITEGCSAKGREATP